MRWRWTVSAALVLAACKDPAPRPRADDAGARPQRVFDPPPGEVRPVPPHAIRADGVGPYLIGMALDEVLDLLSRGPRIELFEIEGVAAYNLVRSESDALLIGADPKSGVRFVAVFDKQIAQTGKGSIGVGSTEEQLRAALGPERRAANRATDPRMLEFRGLPGVRFVMRGDKVRLVVVAPREGQPREDLPSTGNEPAPPQHPPVACRDAGPFADAGDAEQSSVIEAANLGVATRPRVSYGCISAASSREALVVGGNQLALVGGDAANPRRLALHRGPGLRWAGALDVDGDGRDEIAALYGERSEQGRSVRVALLRWDGSRLTAFEDAGAYSVSAAGAAATGADLNEVDLLVEVEAVDDDLRFSGLYVHRGKRGPRNVALLEPHVVPRGAKRPAPRPPRPDSGEDASPATDGDEGFDDQADDGTDHTDTEREEEP